MFPFIKQFMNAETYDINTLVSFLYFIYPCDPGIELNM